MSNPILIDTSFIVALVNVRDEHHQRAVDFSFRLEESPTLVTDAILLEIGASLARGFRKEGIAIIEKLLASPQVQVVRMTPALFDQGFSLYKQQLDKTWSLVDCISFAVMREQDIREALTLDHHFQQAGFDALMREE